VGIVALKLQRHEEGGVALGKLVAGIRSGSSVPHTSGGDFTDDMRSSAEVDRRRIWPMRWEGPIRRIGGPPREEVSPAWPTKRQDGNAFRGS